mgnify:FL=1
MQGELFGRLKKAEISIENSPVCAEALGGLLDLIADETISGRIAKDVFEEMWGTGKGAAAIVEEKGLKQITDTSEIETVIDSIIDDNQDNADEIRGGNMKAIGWFVGQVMQATGGKANPKAVNELLRKKLSG